MSHSTAVTVRELAAWGFDEYAFRSIVPAPRGEELVAERAKYQQRPMLVKEESGDREVQLQQHATRPELLSEMSGLDWSLGTVDLRHLLSFQRRLAFDPQAPELTLLLPGDWSALIDLAFGPPKAIDYTDNIKRGASTTLVLQSSDPNLQFHISAGAHQPLRLYAGSPFLEVASFRGRWFLRDGYHRAYALLQKDVFFVPAVIVRAKTLAELGATRPWFFSEDILFSDHPPMVTDFLDDQVTVEYVRPRLLKTLRVTVEESFTAVPDPITESTIEQETTHEHCNQAR